VYYHNRRTSQTQWERPEGMRTRRVVAEVGTGGGARC
jgi:hypothetical protein